MVEQTFALLHHFKRLAVRWEHRTDLHDAFIALACSLICYRRLKKARSRSCLRAHRTRSEGRRWTEVPQALFLVLCQFLRDYLLRRYGQVQVVVPSMVMLVAGAQ